MAKTFDISRVVPGTIELVRDSSGNYTTKVVGLKTINSLSLPELSTVAAVTKTDTDADTKTASQLTEDTVQSQTQAAFRMPQSDRDSVMATGDMITEAKKTSEALANVTTPTTIQDSMLRSDRLTAEEAAPQENILTIKDPTEKVFKQSTDDIDYVDAIRRGETGVKFVEKPKLGDDLFKLGPAFDDKGTAFARPEEGTIDQASKDRMVKDDTRFLPSNIATRSDQGEMVAPGIETKKTEPVYQDAIMRGDTGIKPEIKQTALETVSTSLRSSLKNIKTPMMMLADMVATPRGESAGAVAHNKQYFTDRGDGRIGGNPATDLYAGMNRVSKFGNLAKAGDKRIARREKTIATKNVSQKFIDDTNKMKEQANDYKESLKSAPVTGTTKPGTSGGADRGGGRSKIVCTMMNESYGFGSFRNKIWLRHSKNLAPEYQIGYHRIFLPLVKKAKTNKVLKKILEHIAIHRTIDIRQEERNKIHLLGRVYRTILEPICYWIGKI